MDARKAFHRGSILLAVVLSAGCSSTTLFRSNFTPTPIGQAPTTADIGTVRTAGAVTVIAAPVLPSGKWVQMSRANADTPNASFQGNLKEVKGNGRYTFSATVFMPSSTTQKATIQFERQNEDLSGITNFLHLDLLPSNQVRLDDLPATDFGMFPRDKPFIVQVTLDIGATSTAHIVLAGDGASGTKDHAILPPFIPMAHQFGAVRLAMQFPNVGTLQATNISVTRRND
jgi:hypothetical protein